jgi:hypothetical protein
VKRGLLVQLVIQVLLASAQLVLQVLRVKRVLSVLPVILAQAQLVLQVLRVKLALRV